MNLNNFKRLLSYIPGIRLNGGTGNTVSDIVPNKAGGGCAGPATILLNKKNGLVLQVNRNAGEFMVARSPVDGNPFYKLVSLETKLPIWVSEDAFNILFVEKTKKDDV